VYHSRSSLALFALLGLVALIVSGVPPSGQTQEKNVELKMEKDSPPDSFPYSRQPIPEDFTPGGRPALPTRIAPSLPTAIFPTAIVADVVVNNTNPNLINTDTANDGEPSIAIDPNNTNEIVISAFSGSWGANAPIWHSLDGGVTWTEQNTVPAPPGIAAAIGCPCDQAFDFGRMPFLGRF
jgi:hypothetical protein